MPHVTLRYPHKKQTHAPGSPRGPTRLSSFSSIAYKGTAPSLMRQMGGMFSGDAVQVAMEHTKGPFKGSSFPGRLGQAPYWWKGIFFGRFGWTSTGFPVHSFRRMPGKHAETLVEPDTFCSQPRKSPSFEPSYHFSGPNPLVCQEHDLWSLVHI